MAIRTLVFDLGKVLVDFTFDHAYTRMQTACGLTQDEIRARLFDGVLTRDFETGRMDAAAFVAEVNRRMGTQLKMDEFTELWSCIFHPEALVPEPMLRDLKCRHRLVLLSNTNPLHFEMIRANYPHIAHFDGLVLSHEVGAMKPDEAIYRAAIELAQCEAGECLFFDDLAENVAGARAAGMNAEQFTGVEQLRLHLAHYGVECA